MKIEIGILFKKLSGLLEIEILLFLKIIRIIRNRNRNIILFLKII